MTVTNLFNIFFRYYFYNTPREVVLTICAKGGVSKLPYHCNLLVDVIHFIN